MLRFPNPGSNVANFVAVYRAAFERLNGYVVSLDDIIQVVVAANLATSSGYVGKEAIARSTRDDRSRDPLYNQLKMYAELFRAHGWLHPTEGSSLHYTFTLLGQQLVSAADNYLPLFRETVLGIVYPSKVLQVLGDFDLRPFAFLLKTMYAAGGHISRDEMIIAPLNMSDRSASAIGKALDLINEARACKEAGQNLLNEVSKKRKVQVNTLHNYTRWPIAVLRDSGWVEKGEAKFKDGKNFDVFRLTLLGRTTAEWLTQAHDIRLNEIEKLSEAERKALSIKAHYEMLGRSDFDLTPMLPILEKQQELVYGAQQRLGFTKDRPLLFSPFQTLDILDTNNFFPSAKPSYFNRDQKEDIKSLTTGRDSREHLFAKPIYVRAVDNISGGDTEGLQKTIKSLLKKHNDIHKAAEAFVEAHSRDTKIEFYPLISQLFEILKYKSDYSRAGVHSQRWDACVYIDKSALPVEIKSPTEEVFLSTKAVRQALENKIVLLSRGGLATLPKLSSLIVGYKLPNERGDMSTLIDDIFHTYGFSIGVIDLYSLSFLAMRTILKNETISKEQLGSLRGYLNV